MEDAKLRSLSKVRADPSQQDKSASQQIDAIISKHRDWKGKTLSELRALIRKADPGVLEEVKWKKPSKPEGVPVWSHDGIICIGEALKNAVRLTFPKNAVRLTFPKGARVEDPRKLFNTRLESNSIRAIDFREADIVNEAALRALILEAVKLNMSKLRAGSS